jgi:SAM-dependent methyltransferase
MGRKSGPRLNVEGVARQMRRSYDRIAPIYNRSRGHCRWRLRVLSRFTRLLPHGGRVLDLGCAVGEYLRTLHKEGFRVAGIDQSPKMVEFARRRVPQASVFCRDMVKPGFSAESFDGILSLFAIIHVPQARQPEVFRHMYRLLVPGGHFLINLGAKAREYVGEHYGEWLYWSGASLPESFRRIRRAGFKILWHQGLGPRDDYSVWIIARKPMRE